MAAGPRKLHPGDLDSAGFALRPERHGEARGMPSRTRRIPWERGDDDDVWAKRWLHASLRAGKAANRAQAEAPHSLGGRGPGGAVSEESCLRETDAGGAR